MFICAGVVINSIKDSQDIRFTSVIVVELVNIVNLCDLFWVRSFLLIYAFGLFPIHFVIVFLYYKTNVRVFTILTTMTGFIVLICDHVKLKNINMK